MDALSFARPSFEDDGAALKIPVFVDIGQPWSFKLPPFADKESG